MLLSNKHIQARASRQLLKKGPFKYILIKTAFNLYIFNILIDKTNIITMSLAPK